MHCTNCGQPLPEGTQLCPVCGQEQAVEIPREQPQEAAPFALNLQGEMPQEPSEKGASKGKKIALWVTSGVLALMVVATCLVGFLALDWGLYIRDFFQRMKEPEEYKNIVEERAVTEGGMSELALLKKGLLNAYGDSRELAEKGGRETTVQLELGGKLRSLLELALMGDEESLEILETLESVDLTVSTANEAENLQGTLTVGANGEHVATVDVVLDVQGNTLYMTIPELNETSVAIDLETANPMLQELAYSHRIGRAWTDFMLRCPDEQSMAQLLDRYLVLAIREIRDVEKKTDKVEAGGVTQKVTVLTYDITDETARAMAIAMLEEARDDDQMLQLLDSYSQMAEQINAINEERVEKGLIDQDALFLLPLIDGSSIDDTIAQVEAWEVAGDTLVTVDTYVNRKGQITGRSYRMEAQDVQISYCLAVKGRNVGMEVQMKTPESKMTLAGSAQYKKGVLNGSGSLKTDGLELFTVKLTNVALEGKSGTVLVELGSDMREQLKEETGLSTAVVDFSKLGVEVVYTENTTDIALRLGTGDLLRVRVEGQTTQPDKIRLPENATDDAMRWVRGIELDTLRDLLRKTGIHEELIDAFLEGFAEGLTDTDIQIA